MNLKFDEKGLIPAIVQDHYTKEVLTLAYMNAETLALTIAEPHRCRELLLQRSIRLAGAEAVQLAGPVPAHQGPQG